MVSSRRALDYKVEYSIAEGVAYDFPDPIGILEWVESRRFLSVRSEERGPMRLSRTPYVRPWLEASVDPDVEEVVVCASAQVAKTEFGLDVAGYYADVMRTTVLISLADEQTARHISRDRLRKMFEDSPELLPLIDGAPVINNDELELNNGAYLGVVWASSVSALGTKAFRVTIADEIDKPGYYVKTAEAMPLSLIRERTESYFDFKHIFFSTPTGETGNITLELEACDVVADWHVPCPHCDTYQPLRFSPLHAYGFDKGYYRGEDGGRHPLGRVHWEGRSKATPDQIKDARYQCGTCSKLWTTAMKNRAVTRGRSVPRIPFPGKPKRVGFHVNRLYSLLGKSGNLDKIVDAFIKAKQARNPRVMQGFINSTLAEPYIPNVRPRSVDIVGKLRDDRPRGLVPHAEPVACLLAGIDTQDDGFFYEIRAFAYGLARTSWAVREGKVPTFEALAQALWSDQYFDINGKEYTIRWSLMDAMGHRTSEVYDFCRLNRGKIAPTMGVQRMNQPYAYTELTFYPNSKRPIPGGLKLIRLDTNFFKSRLSGILEIHGGDPGAWNYHAETTDDWIQQMTVEVLDDKNVWVNPKELANHAWDCSVLQLCAHEILGVAHWELPKTVVTDRRTDSSGGSSGWITGGRGSIGGAGKGWLKRE